MVVSQDESNIVFTRRSDRPRSNDTKNTSTYASSVHHRSRCGCEFG